MQDSSQPEHATATVLQSGQTALDASHYDGVRDKIRSDAVALLTDASKRSTNLSLALKRRASASSSSSSSAASKSALSLIDGLDQPSIAAAQSQIDHFTNDLVPKLVFLTQKAWKERSVYRRNGQDSADATEAAEDRRKLEEEAQRLGGTVMTGAELGLSADGSFEKVLGAGLGATWATTLRVQTFTVMDAIAGLADACMDERTRAAMKAAQNARSRGSAASASLFSHDDSTQKRPATLEKLREHCLIKTAAIWEACDEAVKALPTNNLESIRKRWGERKELMEDGLREMVEDLRERRGEEGSGDISLDTLTLSEAANAADGDQDDSEFALIQRMIPLIRMGRLLHDRAGDACLIESEAGQIDIDELDQKAEHLSAAQDDLVAAVLYGDLGEPTYHEAVEDDGSPTVIQKDKTLKDVVGQYLAVAQKVATATGKKDKAQQAYEDMAKFVQGIKDEDWDAWAGAWEDDEDDDGEDEE